MNTRRLLALWLIGVSALMCFPPGAGAQDQSEPVRALVVDRTKDTLWLGLPGPVKAGAVFDIMLVPGDKVIARATVIESTPDAPYVAKAKFAMEDPTAFIPVGAYAEATQEVIARDRDQVGGYEEITLGPRGINPLSLTAGAFFPTESSLRDETRTIWSSFQLNYRLARSETITTSLGVGYYHGDGDFTVGDESGSRDFRVLPVTVDMKIGMGRRGAGGYVLLGVGAYNIRDERTVGGVRTKTDVTTFGWQAGAGWESRSGRSVQLKYTDSSRTDFKGLVLSVGARF